MKITPRRLSFVATRRASDRRGFTLVEMMIALVLFGVGINVVGLLLMGFSTTLTPILIGRFISGLGIGAVSPGGGHGS